MKKMTFFGLKEGQDLEYWAAHLHQEFPGVPPPLPSGGILNGRIVLSEVIAYRGLSVLKVRICVEECEDLNLQIEATSVFSRYDRLLALCIQFITHFLFINAIRKEIACLMYGFCDSYNDRHFVCFC